MKTTKALHLHSEIPLNAPRSLKLASVNLSSLRFAKAARARR